TPTPSSCAACHADSRPDDPHPQSVDCASCHTSLGGGWSTVTWDHTPTPSSCAACHEDSRPSSGHPQKQDCAMCHDDPGGSWARESGNREGHAGGGWSAVTWDHTPTPSSSAARHAESRPSYPHAQRRDCASCHTY
ncbi:MAG: cytochrome c3 family protein, partial [Planctomycetota bacterium]